MGEANKKALYDATMGHYMRLLQMSETALQNSMTISPEPECDVHVPHSKLLSVSFWRKRFRKPKPLQEKRAVVVVLWRLKLREIGGLGMERVTGVEPATLCLASIESATASEVDNYTEQYSFPMVTRGYAFFCVPREYP